jgi:hypothetical protein
VASPITAQQIDQALGNILNEISAVLCTETKDRQLCLENVDVMLTVLQQQVRAGYR